MDRSTGRRPSVAIIGGGFSGVATAIGLKRAGYEFTIFERADRVGGVWLHNTYPGAACDVASSLYSYSFEPNPDWSRPFAPQQEIQAYLEHCVRKYGIAEHIRFGTEVVAAEFADGRWRLRTRHGETHTADVLVPACGQLSRPSYPRIGGIDRFAGTAFHSARWDHDHDLTGRRVAVIGNGASAVQLVPHVAQRAAELSVFQRSAEYLVPKPDYAHRRWQTWAYRHLPGALKLMRGAWWTIGEYLNPALVSAWGRHVRHAWLSPFLLATKAQLRLQVRDPELRRKLTPDYTMGCKRILLSSDYYPALAKPHVHLVTDSVTEIAPEGVVTADGATHQVDTIIFATGFATNGFVAPMRITGLDGRELDQAWADGPAAYLGMTVPGFPNLFLMYGPNTNFGGGSIVYILECQARYILQAVRALNRTGAAWFDVRGEVHRRFEREVRRRLASSVWATGGCTSWYTHDGKVTNNWPGLMFEYRRRTRKFELSEYEVASRAVTAGASEGRSA